MQRIIFSSAPLSSSPTSLRTFFFTGLWLSLWFVSLVACDQGGVTPPDPTIICKPNETKECFCLGNVRSKQTCRADGKAYGDCDCEQKTGCVLGDQRECSCQSGGQGEQSCIGNDQWSACNCPTCTPGEKSGCNCADGSGGSRTCNADGQGFTACACVPSGCRELDTLPCQCRDGQNGVKVCRSSAWSDCEQCGIVGNQCDKVGEKEACICPNGGQSTRTCRDNKTWTSCNCGGPTCQIGDVQLAPCLCSNGMTGKRFCVEGPGGIPEWGVCDCSCKDGEKLACDCPNGTQGQRDCECTQASCQWTSCRCALCKNDDDCKNDPDRPRCNGTLSLCVGCLDDSDCKQASLAHCFTTSGTCSACTEDSHCANGESCDPLDRTCKVIQKGSIQGTIRRCEDGASHAGRCTGNPPSGDAKGPIYFLFYGGTTFPPPQSQKPTFVRKLPETDFSSHTATLTYKLDDIPPGMWIVYVFLDDNDNWSMNRHLPDPGDLVGFINDVEIKSGQTVDYDFFLRDRY